MAPGKTTAPGCTEVSHLPGLTLSWTPITQRKQKPDARSRFPSTSRWNYMWWSSSSHLWLRSSELVYLQLTSSLVWIKPLHVQRSETSEWFGTWAGRRRNQSSARDTIKAGIAGKPHKPREKTQVKHFRDCQRFFLLACVFKVDVKKFSYCGSKLARYWIPLWLFFLSTVSSSQLSFVSFEIILWAFVGAALW